MRVFTCMCVCVRMRMRECLCVHACACELVRWPTANKYCHDICVANVVIANNIAAFAR